MQDAAGPQPARKVSGGHSQETCVVQYEMILDAPRPGKGPGVEAGKDMVRHSGDEHGHESQKVEMNMNKAQALAPLRLGTDHHTHHHPEHQVNQRHLGKTFRVNFHQITFPV